MQWVCTNRYWTIREPIFRPSSILDNRLNEKYHQSDLFWKAAQMSPESFDALVSELEGADVFHNQSNNAQMSVERQVLIALKRFGAYENDMSLHDVADWARIRYGTVDLITRRVIIAVLDTNLRACHIRWPIEEERESAKEWVENQTCSAFRDGWYIVDGTTIPIFEKLHYFGGSFYDQKPQYSINAQIINTPNRQVIDYVTGFNGSRHDTHCFGFTRLSKHHKDLLPNGE